jgi:hypothetical protein
MSEHQDHLNVERFDPPRPWEELHGMGRVIWYGVLRLPSGQQVHLDHEADVTALEALVRLLDATIVYAQLFPAVEHQTFAPGSRTRELMLALRAWGTASEVAWQMTYLENASRKRPEDHDG